MLNFLRGAKPAAAQQENGLRYRPAPDVKASVHADGVILIQLKTGTVFSANRAGAMIWNGATQRWSLDRVAHSISEMFGIPAQRVRDDTVEFLAQLQA